MLEHNPILNSYLGQNEHQLPFPGDDFLPNPHQPIPPFFKDSLPEDISLESPFTEDKNTPPMIPAKQILDSLAFDDSNLEGLPKPKTNINT
jgi:hypothetical protein